MSACRLYLGAILLSALSLAACTNRDAARRMDAAEACMNERPDSALAVLQDLDTAALRTRAQKARYALLRVMALDKNYRDITADHLLAPADVWYARRGTPDEKLKLYYYQGRILQAKNELCAAAVRYRRAETLADKARDAHAVGLLYETEASVYNAVYNIPKDLEYTEKALGVFKHSGDSMYGSVLGELAMVYHSMECWEEADSLYREAIGLSDPYPHAQAVYLSNYARLKVLRPDKDPAGAIGLLERKQALTGKGLRPKEAGAYAYAAELLGDRDAVDDLLPRLEAMTGPARFDVLFWLARIAVARGDYESAYYYREESHDLEEATIRNVLTDSVAQTLFEDAVRQEELAGLRFRTALLAAGLVILALLSIVLWSRLRRRRIEAERNRLLDVRDVLRAELERSENRAAALRQSSEGDRDLGRKIETLQERIRSMEDRVARERESYTRERVNRLRQLGEIRSVFWWNEHGGLNESLAVAAIKKEVNYIFQTENDGRVLVRRLDRELDGAVSRLRTALRLRGNPREVLFLCCCILDLEPEMIAEILGISKSNVYTKRSRLRTRIQELGDPLLSILVEKSVR